MRLLLIDDNEEITEAIGYYCKSAKDIDCQVISEGKEGLESIRNEEFDLIMLDLAMPEFTGLDVIKSLKQDGKIESKNIVIFTASSDRKVLDEIKNSGVKEIFKKPCSLDDLVELIEKYRPRTIVRQRWLF